MKFLPVGVFYARRFSRMMSQSTVRSQPCRVAVTQMTSVSNKEENLKTCENLIMEAVADGAQMVFLPEGCDYIAETKQDSIDMAESMDGPTVSKYQKLAASKGVWLSLGGLHIKEKGEDKLSNTHLVIDDKGEIVSSYKKAHLFSVHIPEKNLHLEESAYVSKGEAIHPPIVTPAGKVALAICYDLRFPELSLLQRKHGAEILTFPSAFTVTTGRAHWETILRSRAIETQCYVIAAAQTGQHSKKRSSYGHAMIVDPWGPILSELSEGTGYSVVDIDLNHLNKIRKDMPVMSHRRSDLYHLYEIPYPDTLRLCDFLPMPSPYVSYQFGNVSIPGSCVFLKTHHSQAFVNKKPVTPGHTLVTTERPAKRLTDLTAVEICDIVQVMQTAVGVTIKEHNPKSIQVAIQDGPAAGQTIEHVHIHIVPLNAALKQQLQGHENDVKWREIQELEAESFKLRKVAINNSSRQTPVIFRPFEITEPTFQENPIDIDLHIPESVLIARTRYACAFVAPHPILHGHVCVATLQPNISLQEAMPDVLTELFLTVQLVQKHVEDICNMNSSTIVMFQDLEKDNNEHLQVHIIPRTEGDFPDNDDIYSAVNNYDWQSCEWSNLDDSSSLTGQLRSAIYKDI